ncbi:tetratricopeptide repeat protein [Sphingomonas sp. 28-63-12]|uniref:tetratricopeptide repeat protein n=1 Tax=Sphingomonas sp. 28-63-12 TaxID=1970434 RepID=UPI000BD865E2|nr:MAG: hypothetical protein B7Y47_07660 [Sphingomonas sp. 28-63-12]
MLIAAPVPVLAENGQRDLSAYLRARAADADGNVAAAADGYAAALRAAPNDAVIAVRAYRVAIAAGDFALLNHARGVLERADLAPADASLLALAEAVRANDPAATQLAINRVKAGALGFLAPSFQAWAALDDPKTAKAALDMAGGNAIARRYAQETRALLLIATGKPADGAALVQVLSGGDRSSVDLRITAAQLLAHAGQQEAARALLPNNDPTMAAVRDNLGQGRAASTALGVAFVLTRLASDLNDGQASRLLIVMARAALRVDPANDRARLLLVAALAREDNPQHALVSLVDIAPTSPYYPGAQALRIALLDKAGNTAAALASAAALADRPDSTVGDIRRHADLLLQDSQVEAAASAYQRALDRDQAGADWVLYLQLGSALDRAGHWPKAKAALEQAVSLAPDEPVALNYLGYGLLEHGGDKRVARQLLEHASMLRPQDFSILDSLAWAYFLQGESTRALPLLEAAAKGEPANSTIGDHLGDAYWQAGRRYEARYAWQAAALLAEGGDADRIAAKIANGPATR